MARFTPVNQVIKKNKLLNEAPFLTYPPDLTTHGLMFMFFEYRFAGAAQFTRGVDGNPKAHYLGATVMPFPKAIQVSNNVKLASEELGPIMRGLIGEGANLFGDSGDMTAGAAIAGLPALAGTLTGIGLNSIMSAGGSVGKMAKVLAAVAGGGVTASRVGKGVQMGVGMAVNNKAALMYNGTELRSHNFTWDMTPRSESESDRMIDVILQFKRHQAGRVTGDALGAFVKWPSVVQALWLGVDKRHYPAYKPFMIRNVNETYSDGVLAGGRPRSCNLSLDVIETDIVTQDDWTKLQMERS